MSEPDAMNGGRLRGRPADAEQSVALDGDCETGSGADPIAVAWHADEALLSRYARRETDQSTAMVLERHLIECHTCRAALACFADPERLERGREAVLAAISAPRRGILERLMIKVGMSEATARLVAATPSLRASWFAAVTIALGFAVVAAKQRSGITVFLAVAPLLPVIGVAAAYGPGVDPTYSIGLAAPLSSLRLLLLRLAAVLTTTTILAGLAGLALPDLTWSAAWLLPSLSLTLGSVALSTLIPPMNAARFVVVAWLVIVVASANDGFTLFGSAGQLGFALLAAVAALVIAHRREVFDQGRRR